MHDVRPDISKNTNANVGLFINANEKPYLFGIHPFNELRHFVFATLAIIGGWAWMKSGWLFYRYSLHHFRLAAPISYVIYISHDPLMRDATYLGFIENSVLRWFAYFLVMLFVSYVIEILFYPAARRWLQPRIEALFSGTQQ